MFARLFTADLGVSTFPIGDLFYFADRSQCNGTGIKARPNAFQRRSREAPALRVSDAWVVFRPNYLPFHSITAAKYG